MAWVVYYYELGFFTGRYLELMHNFYLRFFFFLLVRTLSSAAKDQRFFILEPSWAPRTFSVFRLLPLKSKDRSISLLACGTWKAVSIDFLWIGNTSNFPRVKSAFTNTVSAWAKGIIRLCLLWLLFNASLAQMIFPETKSAFADKIWTPRLA